MNPSLDKATLGGGCFWCLEAVYQELDGVETIVSGYAGGHVANPTYEQVCSKTTGHAEVVQLEYDASRVTFAELLTVFFATHDPTTPDRQGNDVGPQYRSVIFHHTAEQERVARETIAQLTADAVFPDPIVTQIAPLDVFYPADAHHQNYFRQHGSQPYCTFVISPKVAKMRKQFASRLRRSR
jgi:peptide-methionine (S)-S-oxide reductase